MQPNIKVDFNFHLIPLFTHVKLSTMELLELEVHDLGLAANFLNSSRMARGFLELDWTDSCQLDFLFFFAYNETLKFLEFYLRLFFGVCYVGSIQNILLDRLI